MASAQSQWPPALKKFVNDTFAQCTDATRPKVEEELKKIIFEAYQKNSLWSTSWDQVKLISLAPPGLKRKLGDATPASFAYTNAAVHLEESKRDKRMKRFANSDAPTPSTSAAPSLASRLQQGAGWKTRSAAYLTNGSNGLDADPTVIDWDKETIVGRSTKLEKAYLRLTSVPDPNNVRPLHILKQAFEMVKSRWRDSNGEDYAYVCDQFKSIRQDLVVQRIKNDFTVLVYEFHARTALEKGDLGEFNQCQTMLRDLYKLGLGASANRLEFLGYRILYFLFSRNSAEISHLLPTLTDEERLYEGVRHALRVRSALASSNYVRFFKLWAAAPKMGGYLMDHMLDRERVSALSVISKSYRTISLSYVAGLLGFDEPDGLHDFLVSHKAAFYASPTPPPAANSALAATPINPVMIPMAQRQIDCRQAQAPLGVSMRSLFKIDIKGQI